MIRSSSLLQNRIKKSVKTNPFPQAQKPMYSPYLVHSYHQFTITPQLAQLLLIFLVLKLAQLIYPQFPEEIMLDMEKPYKLNKDILPN